MTTNPSDCGMAWLLAVVDSVRGGRFGRYALGVYDLAAGVTRFLAQSRKVTHVTATNVTLSQFILCEKLARSRRQRASRLFPSSSATAYSPFRTTMADAPAVQNQTSPISSLLRTLGMTREDLVLHTEQMRAYLSQPNSSQPEPESEPEETTRTLRRSRTESFSKSARPPLPSPSPPTTPVKSEPVEASLPLRRRDTMEMILEARNKQQAKHERRGPSPFVFPPPPTPLNFRLASQSRSRDGRRVSTNAARSPSRSTTPQVRRARRSKLECVCSAQLPCTARPRYPTSLQVLQ